MTRLLAALFQACIVATLPLAGCADDTTDDSVDVGGDESGADADADGDADAEGDGDADRAGGEDWSGDAADVVTEVIVTPPLATIGGCGLLETAEFRAMARFADGSTLDVTSLAEWRSSDESIFVVDAHGVVTGVVPGTASVMATYGGVGSNEATVLFVYSDCVETLQVTPTTATTSVGETQQYTALAIHEAGVVEDVTASVSWTSSDRTFATIDAGGLATGVGGGTTTITATLDGITSNEASLSITDDRLVAITLDPVTATLGSCGSPPPYAVSLTATGHYPDGSTSDITDLATWVSSDNTIATVDAHGVVTADATNTGTVQITASLAPVTSSPAIVTVPNFDCVETVEVSPATASIHAGQSQPFRATAEFGFGLRLDVTDVAAWTTSDASVATIAPGGLAGALVPGTTTITATFGLISGTALLEVTPAVLTSLVVTPSTSTISVCGTVALRATGTFSDLSTGNVTASVDWTSSNPVVAIVSNDPGSEGVVTGAAPGLRVTITATDSATGVAGSAWVDVTGDTVRWIEVLPAGPAPLAIGATQAFTAHCDFPDGSTLDCTTSVLWASSAEAVATISNTAGSVGVATGASVGTTQITASMVLLPCPDTLTSAPVVLTVTP
jgi:hypothetical protein